MFPQYRRRQATKRRGHTLHRLHSWCRSRLVRRSATLRNDVLSPLKAGHPRKFEHRWSQRRGTPPPSAARGSHHRNSLPGPSHRPKEPADYRKPGRCRRPRNRPTHEGRRVQFSLWTVRSQRRTGRCYRELLAMSSLASNACYRESGDRPPDRSRLLRPATHDGNVNVRQKET